MSFIQQLKTGVLDTTDITFLSLMDKVRLSSCVSTTQMRYHSVTKLFCNLAYKEGNGKLLRFLSGPKHFGQVLSGVAEKGSLRPETGSVNFAIPSTNTLARDQKKEGFCQTLMKPGILKQHFPLLPKYIAYILDADGKIVREGLVGTDQGDVDLWGFEEKPTRQDIADRLSFCLMSSEKLATATTSENLGNCILQLSYLIKDLRNVRVDQELRKNRLVTSNVRNPEPKKLEYGMDCYYATVYQINNHLTKLIVFIQDLCHMLSVANGTENLFKIGMINISRHPNSLQLLDENTLRGYYNLAGKDKVFCKQKTELWFELRKKARVTGSTLFNALGLRTTTDHRKHFKQFVLQEEAHFHPDVLLRMQHGTDHEIDGVASVIGCLIPCFLSDDHIFYEVGPRFLHGDVVNYFLEVSADGIVKNSVT